MSGVCGTHGGRRAVHTEFWFGNRRERDHLEDLSEGGKMILKWILPAAPFLKSVLISCHVRQGISNGRKTLNEIPLLSHKRD